MAQISVDREKITEFCQRWRVSRLALFGSVLRPDFRSESDIDVLVEFDPEAQHTLFDLVRMQEELKHIFGREVDLVSRRGLEASRNRFRKEAILSSAEVVYGS